MVVDTRPTQRELESTGSGTDAQHFTNGDKKCCVISPWRGDDVTSNNTGPLAAGSAVEGGVERRAAPEKTKYGFSFSEFVGYCGLNLLK